MSAASAIQVEVAKALRRSSYFRLIQADPFLERARQTAGEAGKSPGMREGSGILSG